MTAEQKFMRDLRMFLLALLSLLVLVVSMGCEWR